MDGWRSLRPALCAHCLRVLESNGFTSPTPVQRETIPHFMSNKDVAVEAVTGSGKTLAFLIPLVEALLARGRPWSAEETVALVITPTRELAAQISGVCASLLPAELEVRLLIGGRDVGQDISAVNQQGSAVVVATPGRLLVLLSRSDCRLATHMRALDFLVLDEADRLLEMGFHQSLTDILRYLPKQRRTGLFSATLTSDVKQLVGAGLRNPVTVTVREPGQAAASFATPTSLHNYYLECRPQDRLSVLLALLDTFQSQKLLVFFATCASVSYFSALALRLCPEMTLLALHGRMHSKRQSVFDRFSAMDRGVLMCTDVMARGVDFPAVDWVLQFDPPSSSNSFVHRCGRTARMGREGRALVLLTPSEASYVEFLRLNKGLALQCYPAPHAPPVRSRARDIIAQERELYELGVRAFVSFVHFYYKHECKLIFQPRALDLLAHAHSFALLHLPKMPELKTVNTATFDPHPIEACQIPYKEEERERERQAQLKEGGREKLGAVEREKRKPLLHKRHKRKQKMSGVKSKKRKGSHQTLSDQDLRELARDAKLLKKFKNGKITEEELDRQLELPR